MGTTFKELKRRTFLGMSRSDGEAVLAVEQGINDAVQIFAQMESFDEMLTVDTTSADTVDGTKSYHLITAWGLTRPKNILTLRIEDTSLSTKLTYIPMAEFDKKFPYPETYSEDRPTIYTRRGMSVELFRIPDAAYDVHVVYNQFPAALTADTDECVLLNFDAQITFLAKDIANAYLSGNYSDFQTRAREILRAGISGRRDRPDHVLIAKPFIADKTSYPSDYWADPMFPGIDRH